MDGVEADVLRAHVARIAASDLFAGAERLCRFLRFTVESKLCGREDEVKEYVLGRKVFDRGDEYDTRLDPIVRVEARRLRARLIEYYNGPGRDEPLRLEYPKGTYVPVVSTVERARQQPPRASRGRAFFAIAAAALVCVVVVAFALLSAQRPVMMAPVPVRWIEPDDGTLDPIDVALAQDVDAQLANRPTAAVVAWPEIARRSDMRGVALRDVAAALGASQLLVVAVRDLHNERLVRIFLIDEPAGRKRLALTYSNPPLQTESSRDALAARIALDVLRTR
jgi:hypothetical protein